MQINPYLLFSGQCEEAFKFYAKCLGGKIEDMHTHGNSPMADQVTPEWRDKIMHVQMKAGDNVLMGSDAPPQHFQKPQGFSVSLQLSDTAEGERVFQSLAEGGTTQMPFQETFWAAGFGMLVDRFGIPWMVNCPRPA